MNRYKSWGSGKADNIENSGGDEDKGKSWVCPFGVWSAQVIIKWCGGTIFWRRAGVRFLVGCPSSKGICFDVQVKEYALMLLVFS